ncbi:hypothetical protein L226DRAFT_575604 [Lentinus tigrinus ALCF2SS1-7]|uniref:uncharacterized protein n=1 Tax=Lentinus tigrinus ALCF2SS1-7 TaxID=1328758 RepID=UPI001166035B|nr:hypothetical protein L226DRAFT_575604 [Lentinus tigrinus ALCF2SS1-7]
MFKPPPLPIGMNGFIVAGSQRTSPRTVFPFGARSVKKAGALKTLFADHASRLEFAVVEGIAADGAFYDAEPEAFVGPAIRGTTGILKSVQAHGPSVKCTVTISSVGTVCSYPNGDGKLVRVFTSADWNDEDIAALEKQGKNAVVATK